MIRSENHNKYNYFREKYPVFEYTETIVQRKEGGILVSFVFKVGEEYVFRPELFFPTDASSAKLTDSLLQALAFNIGMVEMISYWKAFCSPLIFIKPFKLQSRQENWWKNLFRHGLGEFFYTNGIEIPGEELVQFAYGQNAEFHNKFMAETSEDKVIIPLGGGKDSVVTLNLLKENGLKTKILVLNQRGATRDVIEASGIKQNDVIEVIRNIDPLLLELNEKGFLNGHTPFSALLAFVSTMVSALTGCGKVALSNESSANEPTIPGTIINHQYSKSLEFEADFRLYLSEFLVDGINYFSFLRPLNELQIAALFSKIEKYHGVFKSCNAGSKTDSWCCNCSKCLFTYIILSPFIEEGKLVSIFEQNLFEKKELASTLEELTGISENKPFECVGTIEEINAALQKTIKDFKGKRLPHLLEHYKAYQKTSQPPKHFDKLLKDFQHPHFVEKKFEIILMEALQNINAK